MVGRDTTPKVAEVVSSMSKSDRSDKESIPPKITAKSTVMAISGDDSSDNKNKDAIRVQEFKVKMETEKLARLRAKYVVKKELLRRKR